MKLTLPLTGTVLVESLTPGANDFAGDPNDPVRPVDIDLGNVSWQMVSINIENEVMVIEVQPSEKIAEPTGEVDAKDKPIYRAKETTEQEKAEFLQYAQGLVNHSKDELYTMSKCPKLKRPFKKEKK